MSAKHRKCLLLFFEDKKFNYYFIK